MKDGRASTMDYKTNITIGPLKRTKKRLYFEIMITYLQHTQIWNSLDNFYKTVLGSKNN